MNANRSSDVDRLKELPEGLIEYEARCRIRELKTLYGFDTMRQIVAGMINEEADRRPQNGNR